MSLFDWLRPARPARRRAPAGAKACPHCATALPGAALFCFICGREIADGGGPGSGGGGRAGDALEVLRARLAHTLEGRYQVRDVLGAGGMGVVLLADDLTLDRAVAIKVLPPEVSGDVAVVSRFRREARTAARLDHPGIIPIHRVESEGGLHYFTMKYVAGRSLEAVLCDEAPLSVPFATRVLVEAATALAHAHRHGVVHRDVKPANIMLDADERVILTDFGISKAPAGPAGSTTSGRLTELGTVVGTPHYMAPEQAVGRAVDGRADQYALAVVGFEMLTGRVPFDEESPHAIIHRHINEAPPGLETLRPDVPRHVAAAIARALLKAPSHRFATMEAFAAALMDGAPAAAALSARSRTFSRPTAAVADATPTRILAEGDGASGDAPSRGRWVAALAAVLLAGLLGAGAWVGGADGGGGARGVARRALEHVGLAPARASKAPTAARAKSGRRRSARLSVAATPRATVFIDGVRAGETPLAGRALTVGRSYRIRVERKGYRTKRETITVTGTRPIRRSYVLERDGRR